MSIWERLGSVLGTFWEHLGSILERFEASWERFWESGGRLGNVLEGFVRSLSYLLFQPLDFILISYQY